MDKNRFGDLIRNARKAKGMTLEQVAKKIGSHKGYISGIENGMVNPPSPKIAKQFAKLFGLNVKELIFIAWTQKAPQEIRNELPKLFTEVGV